jgi:hypothetical protein
MVWASSGCPACDALTSGHCWRHPVQSHPMTTPRDERRMDGLELLIAELERAVAALRAARDVRENTDE